MNKRFAFRELPVSKPEREVYKNNSRRGVPWLSMGIMAVIVLGCLFAECIMTKDPKFLDLEHYSTAPNREFLFGTDTLGRDIFSCIWYGGRVSIGVGFYATLLSTLIGVVYGTVSGLAPKRLDGALMRLTEVFMSIPGLLTVLFIQAILGKPNVLSVSVAIGVTSWYTIAKIVRTEVRQLRKAEYIAAAKCMGGGFFHILWRHLVPNFIPSILFMVVMNIRTAVGTEAVLSFMGMGLPLEMISWGSMLSLAEKALMSGSWWMILIPGAFLVALMICVTDVGNWLRKRANPRQRYL